MKTGDVITATVKPAYGKPRERQIEVFEVVEKWRSKRGWYLEYLGTVVGYGYTLRWRDGEWQA
jgi:hypothetical protein